MLGRMSEFQGEGVTDLTSYRLGVLAERERIIKLLEDDLFHFIIGGETIVLKGEPLEYPLEFAHADSCSGCYAIALIKGEQK